jgi:hypothetical protein
MIGISRQLDELNEAVRKLAVASATAVPGSPEVMALLIRAQVSAAALSASIQVVSTFASGGFPRQGFMPEGAAAVVLPPPASAVEERIETGVGSGPAEEAQLEVVDLPAADFTVPEPAVTAPEPFPVHEEFDIGRLPADEQDLHRRAEKFARVAVQDILLYKREEVNQGRTHKDLYRRLREEIDKSREIYKRRFARIAHHPVDHLYNEVVSVLAEGDPSALGDYPHPVPVARH